MIVKGGMEGRREEEEGGAGEEVRETKKRGLRKRRERGSLISEACFSLLSWEQRGKHEHLSSPQVRPSLGPSQRRVPRQTAHIHRA